jgi:dUTP pyrophosphatase
VHEIGVKLVRPGARPPEKMTPGSAGFDLYAAEDVEIPPTRCEADGQAEVGHSTVPTGIVVQLPQGTVGRIASRSGLSVKSNIEVGAGWVDSDYRGEVMVELKNLGAKPYRVSQGDRIAQLMILPVVNAQVRVLAQLEDTSRGPSGFGSTGL